MLADFKAERAVFADGSEGTQRRRRGARIMPRPRAGAGGFRAHETLKNLTRRARAVIRTGEATPYANVLLYSGVIFGDARRASP